jgi:hypothetical protein
MMNKQFKKVAEKVGFQFISVGTFTTGTLSTNLEKFSELIVRECIAQVRKDENGPAYEAAGRIAQHFGIE